MRLIAVLVAAALALPSVALGQARRRPPGQVGVVGRCGVMRVAETPHEAGAPYVRVLLSDEWDTRAFRGIGSPDAGTMVSVGGNLRPSDSPAGGFDIRIQTVTPNDVLQQQSCLVLEGAYGVGGTRDASTRGSAALGLTFLTRQPLDLLRFSLGFDVGFPGFARTFEATPVQGALISALMSVNEMYRLLPNLEWSLRGRVLLEQRHDFDWDNSIWFSLQLQVGGARVQSPVGSVQGLLGGARLELLFGNSSADFGFRAGTRLAASISSLWPTDVLVPFNLDGVAQLQVGRFFVIELVLGFLVPNIQTLQQEMFFRPGLQVTMPLEAWADVL